MVAEFYAGVDTHRDTHTTAVVDQIGGVQGVATFDTSPAGYRQLRSFISSFGLLTAVGVEGTGSYGAGLTRHLVSEGVEVREVIRPNRQHRRRHGKSDPADAVAAARAVASGDATALPRGDGEIESIRMLNTARRGAVKARTAVANQIRAVIATAPDALRTKLRDRSIASIVDTASRFRPTNTADPLRAAKTVLASHARRWKHLTDEINQLEAQLDTLVAATTPRTLLNEVGVGTNTAAQLLITFGSNPDRVTSEAAFAALCGVSPVDASSGLQQRHRLNRGGDRQANAALHRIIIVRLRYHQPSRDYIKKRTSEGKTKKEAIRCLKRHLARTIYKHLKPAT